MLSTNQLILLSPALLCFIAFLFFWIIYNLNRHKWIIYKFTGTQRYTSGLKQRIQNGTLGHSVNAVDAIAVIRQKQVDTPPEVKDDRGILLNREHSIKDLAQRLTSPVSPTSEDKPLRVSDMAGIVSKAKEELAKSQSKGKEVT